MPNCFQAEVTDLEALVHAVSGGLAPLSVLTVNWDELDALVAKQWRRQDLRPPNTTLLTRKHITPARRPIHQSSICGI
jgi:hypothetical protein